jgi:molybdopterin-guanine dinucleotide biosynthesis protein A
VAAIAAGLNLAMTELVAVVAADMPFAGGLLVQLIEQLATTDVSIDAVIPTDPDGREQPLAAAYRAAALARSLAALGAPEGRSVRDLRAGLTAVLAPVASNSLLLDVDTPDDLAVARRSVPFSTD